MLALSLSRTLKEHGLLKPPADAPKVGDVRYWNGEAFKILEVDWMNEVLVVRHDNDPPQCCGYYSFCNLVDS